MALDPNNRVAILEREERIWDLLVQGFSGVEVAKAEGVSPQVISAIKKRVERRVHKEITGNVEALRARQIGEVRKVRKESWRAWGESCKPAVTKKKKTRGGDGHGSDEQLDVKGQTGNPALLEKIYRGIELEAQLAGTNAPTKIAPTTPDGTRAYQPLDLTGLTDEELDQARALAQKVTRL